MHADSHIQSLLRLADDALILGQRLSAWCGHGPILEEDIAVSNIALDLVGQARNLYTLAGQREGAGRDEDQWAFFRTDREFQNHLLVEQPNGHFGDTMVRQMLFDAFHLEQMGFLAQQKVDEDLAGIAAKAFKEVQYHWEHSSQWVVRLGDGTTESHDKVQQSLDSLWTFTGEFFMEDEVDQAGRMSGLLPELAILQTAWLTRVSDCLKESRLNAPEGVWMQRGGKQGLHSEHLSYLLAEMQTLPRTYPDAVW